MRRLLALLSGIVFGVAIARGAWADPPTVSITYPPPGAIIDQALTPTFLLQAAVTDPDEAISGVTFLVSICLPGPCLDPSTFQSPVHYDVYASPYQTQWRSTVSVQSATTYQYLVSAQAYNASGQMSRSANVRFSVVHRPMPSVTLVAPNGPGGEAGYVAPTSPVLFATASPAGTSPPSTIARVDFLDGATVIGTVTTPNAVPIGYAFVWQNASAGMHLVAARATDTLGYSTTSNPVNVYIVGPNPPPQVTLSAPTTGEVFAPGSTVPLSASATSALGTIQRVEFATADRVIDTMFRPPYTASWVNPPPGNFAIVARAYDDIGVAATSAAAYIQVLASPRVPSVVLTAPTPGATIPSGTPLEMAATALAPDGAIGRVDFYAGSALLGSSPTEPYQFTLANPSAGAQSLTARAYDLQGNVGTSSAVGVTVVNNRPPTVTLTSPGNGAQFTAPATIALAATASDPDGTVAKIEFFAGTTMVATAASAPYNASWNNAAAGSYTLTAVATDNLGATATSATVAITVTAPPPTVTLTAPVIGALYSLGQPIVLAAQASAPQRSISRVEFYSDGAPIGSAPVTGGPSAINVDLSWTGATVGPHALSARVLTSDGASATSNGVNVTVSDLAVILTEPYAGQAFQTPAQVRITASPTETGGTIAEVDFYGDGTFLGSRTSAPYSLLWSPVATGSHTVGAQVRDAAGLTANSSQVTVAVMDAPTLQVDAGIDGGTVADDNASISGIVQAPTNAAVTVNGRVAALDPNGHFFIDGVPLDQGVNTLTLGVTTQQGSPVTKTITLNRTDSKPFQLSIDRQEGIASFDVTLTISNRARVPFQRIEFDANGDGVPEVTLTSLPNNAQDVIFHITSPGIYVITAKVFDAANNVIYSATRRVLAWGANGFARRTLGVYTGMLDRLRAGDIEGALTAITGPSYARFRDVFTALGSDLSSIVDQLGTVQRVIFNDNLMHILVVRQGTSGAQTFMISLLRGEDGIWRIEDM